MGEKIVPGEEERVHVMAHFDRKKAGVRKEKGPKKEMASVREADGKEHFFPKGGRGKSYA